MGALLDLDGVVGGHPRAMAELAELRMDAARLAAAPIDIMDTRECLSLCAPTEEDFPALYALQGRRVALVDLGPNNVKVNGAP